MRREEGWKKTDEIERERGRNARKEEQKRREERK